MYTYYVWCLASKYILSCLSLSAWGPRTKVQDGSPSAVTLGYVLQRTNSRTSNLKLSKSRRRDTLFRGFLGLGGLGFREFLGLCISSDFVTYAMHDFCSSTDMMHM